MTSLIIIPILTEQTQRYFVPRNRVQLPDVTVGGKSRQTNPLRVDEGMNLFGLTLAGYDNPGYTEYDHEGELTIDYVTLQAVTDKVGEEPAQAELIDVRGYELQFGAGEVDRPSRLGLNPTFLDLSLPSGHIARFKLGGTFNTQTGEFLVEVTPLNMQTLEYSVTGVVLGKGGKLKALVDSLID